MAKHLTEFKTSLKELEAAVEVAMEEWSKGLTDAGRSALRAKLESMYTKMAVIGEGLYPEGKFPRSLLDAIHDMRGNFGVFLDEVIDKPSPSGFTAVAQSAKANSIVIPLQESIRIVCEEVDKLSKTGIMKYALPVGLVVGAVVVATQIGK